LRHCRLVRWWRELHRINDGFRGDSDAQLAAWLQQILTNNLADALRHHGRTKRDIARQQSLEANIRGSFERVDSWLEASLTSPSEQVAKKEEVMQLADAIAELPSAQQNAVILHHLQGLSLAKVAQQLERTEAAVAGLLYRGVKNLHELLSKLK
jgi:RNA polymerase sigma-70 factor (ECF subfamily)